VRDLEDCLIAPLSDHRGAFFLSMVVEDKVGVFAKIATEMAKRHISLESIKQFGKRSNHLLKDRTTIPLQEVVLVTHEASEADIRATIEAIRATNFVHGDPKLLRIES
jgi:homoserine dehydrogenase